MVAKVKEVKETMQKPVAVPVNQFMGLTLIASKNKEKLISKLTKDATAALDQYADLSTFEIQN